MHNNVIMTFTSNVQLFKSFTYGKQYVCFPQCDTQQTTDGLLTKNPQKYCPLKITCFERTHVLQYFVHVALRDTDHSSYIAHLKIVLETKLPGVGDSLLESVLNQQTVNEVQLRSLLC